MLILAERVRMYEEGWESAYRKRLDKAKGIREA